MWKKPKKRCWRLISIGIGSKDFFSISNEFIQENKEQVLSFLCEGGAEILYEYHKDYNHNVESMRRLLVAELLGRFREVKYHENDLERELSWNISLPAQKTWQENMKKKQGHFHLWEEDRFLSVMQIGEGTGKYVPKL